MHDDTVHWPRAYERRAEGLRLNCGTNFPEEKKNKLYINTVTLSATATLINNLLVRAAFSFPPGP